MLYCDLIGTGIYTQYNIDNVMYRIKHEREKK